MSVPYLATGVANVASVTAAFWRLGHDLVAATPGDIRDADLLVVPGVGNFTAAAQRLLADDLYAALRERIAQRRPTLGICLGMQLFCERSDEAPDAEGVGVLPGRLQRFPKGVRCPQMGWNTVRAGAGNGIVRTGQAYFANSYALPAEERDGWRQATCTHGIEFVAAAERGPVLLCQFHPELSGAFGHDLLQRWLRRARRTEEAPC